MFDLFSLINIRNKYLSNLALFFKKPFENCFVNIFNLYICFILLLSILFKDKILLLFQMKLEPNFEKNQRFNSLIMFLFPSF
jgi:hypothetical protein